MDALSDFSSLAALDVLLDKTMKAILALFIGQVRMVTTTASGFLYCLKPKGGQIEYITKLRG